MQLAILFALVVIVVFVALRLLFPSRATSAFGYAGAGRPEQAVRLDNGGATNPFHAVSIHGATESCAAAGAIKGKRFLSGEAPGLPLEECAAATCHCTYVHHVDRRRGNGERRQFFGIRHDTPVFPEAGERRVNGGRRDRDLEAA